MPAALASLELPTNQASHPALSGLPPGQHILLVEDDCIPRRIIEFQLTQCGHSVLTAEDGEQAWNLLQNHNCPIVLTDMMMPKVSGNELIRRIRAAEQTRYTYIVLMTSTVSREVMVTALDDGADDFLAKPVDKEELRARIQPGLRIVDLERRLEDQNRELESRNKLLSRTNTKMKRDLDAAASIQQAYLPQSVFDLANVDFAWRYLPCSELGGDMLNILPLDDEHVAIYVMDVSGHGVQAALLAVSASRSLSVHRDPSSVLWHKLNDSVGYQLLPPHRAVESLNSQMVTQSLTGQYFTLVYGILNRRTGQFRYANGGHPAPLLLNESGKLSELPGGGLPIGIVETDYTEHVIQLRPGDRLFFYSDGITESMNLASELFGAERFGESLRRSMNRPLDESITNVLNDVKGWCDNAPIHDDMSLLALEYTPQPASAWNQPPEDSHVVPSEHFKQPSPACEWLSPVGAG